jgi:hypothetical protein
LQPERQRAAVAARHIESRVSTGGKSPGPADEGLNLLKVLEVYNTQELLTSMHVIVTNMWVRDTPSGILSYRLATVVL